MDKELTTHLKRFLEAEASLRETMLPRYLKTLNAERKWLERYVKIQEDKEADGNQLLLFK